MGEYTREAPLVAGAVARGELTVGASLNKTGQIPAALAGHLWILLQALTTSVSVDHLHSVIVYIIDIYLKNKLDIFQSGPYFQGFVSK